MTAETSLKGFNTTNTREGTPEHCENPKPSPSTTCSSNCCRLHHRTRVQRQLATHGGRKTKPSHRGKNWPRHLQPLHFSRQTETNHCVRGACSHQPYRNDKTDTSPGPTLRALSHRCNFTARVRLGPMADDSGWTKRISRVMPRSPPATFQGVDCTSESPWDS